MTELDKEIVRSCMWCRHRDFMPLTTFCVGCGPHGGFPLYEPPDEVFPQSSRDRVAELQAKARKSEFDWTSADEMIAEAVRVTSTDRHDQYAPPEDNFEAIAHVFNGLLHEKLKEPVVKGDIARLMTGMKLVRDAHKPKRDNRVDGVGYLRCLERVEPTDE